MNSPHAKVADSYRPSPYGRRGMVCSGHHLASLAGMQVLQAGGNAVDAAIATAAALGMVEPAMSGPGGDGFIMVYHAATGEVRCINGTGAAPSTATREAYLEDGIPTFGIRSVSVPGIVSAWLLAHEEFGVLPLAEVFTPARELAEEGFPVSVLLSQSMQAHFDQKTPLLTHADSAAIFMPNGRPPQPGELIRNPNYAKLLEGLACDGWAYFYEGPVAEAILKLSAENGGHFAREDLTEQRACFCDPISTDYRGVTVWESPPNSSGHVLLQELNLIERFDIAGMGRNTPESVHVMVEAKKLAFADREKYLGDPEHVDVPVEWLISKEHAANRVKLIDPQRANPEPLPGNAPGHEDTTCFMTADRWGNAVCQLQSIQTGFGSCIVAGDTGVLLNNRMTYWHLEADHPDALMPGKRVRHTMNTVMATREGELILVCGTPGADTQVQTNMQCVSHVLDFGLNPQEALEAPRWRHLQNPMESMWPHTCEDRLQLEGRFEAETRAGLEARGHTLEILPDWGGPGSEQMIVRDPQTGVWRGGTDPRRDGLALAW